MQHSRTLLRRLAVAGAALAMLPGIGGVADAAEVVREGDTLVLRGKPGEQNHLAVRASDNGAGRIELSDRTSHPITAAPALGCTITQTGFGAFADCPVAGVTNLRLEGGDGDDELDISPHGLPFTTPVVLDGGPGADDIAGPTTALAVVILGGDGDDRIQGGQGPDRIDGDDGDDHITAGPGDDVLSGGRRLSADVLRRPRPRHHLR
jgi:hypothetical protein